MTAPTKTASTEAGAPPMPNAGTGAAGPPTPPAAPPPPTPPAAPTFVKPGGGAIPPSKPLFSRPASDGPPAPRVFAITAFLLALFTALVLAEQPVGVGVGLVGVALAAATLSLDGTRDRFAKGCLAAAAVLAFVPALRDSGWVATLSLTGALALASIALTEARTWRETGVGMVAWVGQLLPAPVLLFADATRRAAGRKWSGAGPVLRGTALAALLVFVFGTLFASADEEFARIVRDLFDWDLDLDSIIARSILFAFVLALAGSLWLVSVRRTPRPAKVAATRLGRTEWLIALGSLVVLFAGFVLLQLPELFGGDDRVLLTSGLTYAENARMGFGQLTVAAALTLMVVAASVHYGPAGDRLVRLLCGALCLLTIVVLASSLHRLGLYQDAYGATRLRFGMHALMLWMGAVMLLIVAFGGAGRTALLPRAIVAVSAVFAIGTVALNPDGQIAERNVTRYADTGRIDSFYLTTLSADAVPALRSLPPALRSCVAAKFDRKLGDGDPIASVNLGRAQARDELATLAPAAAPTRASCAGLE